MKNKSLTPHIRFKGYDDEWVSHSLSELGEVRMCKRILKSQTSESGDVPFYKIGTFGKEPDAFISKELFELYRNLYSYPKIGDIIVSAAGTIGRTVVYDGMPSYYQDSNLIWIDNDNKKIDNAFLAIAYLQMRWAISSTTIARIYNDTVRSTTTIAPVSKHEQLYVARFFNSIGEVILDTEREITRLEKMKQASLQKMFPRPGETTPEIRFDGFTEPWKKETFSDVFTPLKNNTLSRDCLNYTTGMAKNIHYGDVLIKFGSVININDDIVPYVNETVSFSQSPLHLLKDGDIIFADTAEDEAVGKCVEIIGATEFNSVSGLHTIAVRPNFSFAPSFLGYYLNSSTYHSQLLPLMQGVKVLSIGRNALATTEICYPTSHEEQRVIGEYFRNLDAIISAKRKKLDKLQNLKQSCLDKMFVNTTAQ